MCDISKGKNQLQCKDAISGLKAIYIANYDDYDFITQSNDCETKGSITPSTSL